MEALCPHPIVTLTANTKPVKQVFRPETPMETSSLGYTFIKTIHDLKRLGEE
jgi:hypothetical protein